MQAPPLTRGSEAGGRQPEPEAKELLQSLGPEPASSTKL